MGKVVGRAKRAPHWAVQSIFRMIYIGIVYVCLWDTHTKICMLKCVGGPNTRMLKVSFGSRKHTWNP